MVISKRACDWLLPTVLWLWLFWHLHYEWSINTQYNYGWAVPVFAGLIFFLRWRRRPNPRPQPARSWSTLAILILALLLPFRVIEEANPDWRLLGWILALLVAALTLLSLARAGGAPWIKHFAFAVCFPLVAVPWPVRLENFIVQDLMRTVTYLAVEIAGWVGVAANQVGNIVELRSGFVGVDDACSGLRTLQAGIMVSLVLGEFLGLRWMRRLALVVCGCAWVFACNVLRAACLVIVTANGGASALERWHDSIGSLAMGAGMAGLLGLAWLWKSADPSGDTLTETAAPVRSCGGGFGGVMAIGWLIVVFGLTEIWYRSHEGEFVERIHWQARWPQQNDSLHLLPIAETTRVILHCDAASSAIWEDPPGLRWWGFFARWKPGRAALQLVRSHSPEICLPAVGRTFVGEGPPLTVQTGSASLLFRVYEFKQAGEPLFVFVSIQDDKRTVSSPPVDDVGWNIRGRMVGAWRGQRNLGQRLLEIAVTGPADYARASEAATKTVSEIVEIEQPTG